MPHPRLFTPIELGGIVRLEVVGNPHFEMYGAIGSLELELKHVRHMLEGLALCEAIQAGYEARLLNEP